VAISLFGDYNATECLQVIRDFAVYPAAPSYLVSISPLSAQVVTYIPACFEILSSPGISELTGEKESL